MKISNVATIEEPTQNIKELISEFFHIFPVLEKLDKSEPVLLYDEKSKTYYIPVHIKAIDFIEKVDFNAVIDGGDDDELYKLNRDITENQVAFATMISDAKIGRTFEDIVVEFDMAYSEESPLKIYGGQHRVKAIQEAIGDKPETYHGFRVYFGLSKDQKVEIATINNTSIAVSNDLLDRMKEQLLGNELREYCQKVGLLQLKQDFSDKKDNIIPTVRVARTFVVNYWKGRRADTVSFHMPVVCKSGGVDEDYLEIRKSIDWDDKNFIEAGEKFTLLHQIQRLKVLNRKTDSYSQFSSKALSMSVVASWSYAAGLYFSNTVNQKLLYTLTDNLGQNEDPLNAKSLSEARLKGIDPDTYRGLGTRSNPDELGRMLEVFIVLVEKATDKKISKSLANAAIQSYEAKKLTNNAAKSLSKI